LPHYYKLNKRTHSAEKDGVFKADMSNLQLTNPPWEQFSVPENNKNANKR